MSNVTQEDNMLTRCHFSPMSNTGQRYIYTGCARGRVVIYDMLTGKEVRGSTLEAVI